MGGFVAQSMATIHPDRVENIVLVATRCSGAAGEDPSDAIASGFLDRATTEREESKTSRLQPTALFPPDYRKTHGKDMAKALRRCGTMPQDIYEKQLQAVVKWRFKTSACDSWKSIASNVLIVQGSEDYVVPPSNSLALAKIAAVSCGNTHRVSRIVFPRVGHGVVMQEPEKLASCITHWLLHTAKVK